MVSAETAEEWDEKGIGFVMSGEYEKAIACFDKTIELDADYVYAYYNRGLAYYYLMQYERAIEDYNKAIELNPNYANAYHNREIALSKLKEQKPTQISTPTPSPTATATEIPIPGEKGVPGFEVKFAIAGLLAVAYLLRRRK